MAALEENAPCWSATMAGEVHLVPFRTQKLSPLAPMVLRSQSVGEQDVADQQGAFFGPGGPPSRERRGPSAVSGDCVYDSLERIRARQGLCYVNGLPFVEEVWSGRFAPPPGPPMRIVNSRADTG